MSFLSVASVFQFVIKSIGFTTVSWFEALCEGDQTKAIKSQGICEEGKRGGWTERRESMGGRVNQTDIKTKG